LRTPGNEHDALQLAIDDPAMRAYLQRYPFGVGPDRAMNARCADAIRNGIVIRCRTKPATVTRLKPEETNLTPEQMARLQKIMDEAGVPQSARAEMIDDYAWEATFIPRDTKNALVIGCGDGTEIMFLRAVCPDAAITALDYDDVIPPARKKATGVLLHRGDLHALLTRLKPEYDLITSNHTLEHLYTPNEILTMLNGLLPEGGFLLSTLPMDGLAGTPFLDKVREIALTRKADPLDFVYVDAGHPWKTNPADLSATLQETGFEAPSLYQREQHLSRMAACGERRFRAEMAVGKALHSVFFAMPRSLTKLLAGKPASVVSKYLLAIERRTWFGTNRLKNRYTPEVLFLTAKKSASPPPHH